VLEDRKGPLRDVAAQAIEVAGGEAVGGGVRANWTGYAAW